MEDDNILSSQKRLKMFRELHGEPEILNDIITKLNLEVGPFKDAEVCLSVGTGYGQYDIMFAKLLLPNLKKFIAIEMDKSCLEELNKNLKDTFGNKLQVEIHEMLIEDFLKTFSENKVLDKKVDVILSFHALYLLTDEKRMEFLRSCINSWLKPETGRFVVINSIKGCDMSKLFQKLKKPLLAMETLDGEIRSFGWKPQFEKGYNSRIDISDPRKNYESMFLHDMVTEEAFVKALKEVACNGIFFQTCKLSIFVQGEGN